MPRSTSTPPRPFRRRRPSRSARCGSPRRESNSSSACAWARRTDACRPRSPPTGSTRDNIAISRPDRYHAAERLAAFRRLRDRALGSARPGPRLGPGLHLDRRRAHGLHGIHLQLRSPDRRGRPDLRRPLRQHGALGAGEPLQLVAHQGASTAGGSGLADAGSTSSSSPPTTISRSTTTSWPRPSCGSRPAPGGRVQLNLDNVTDEETFTRVFNSTSVVPAPGFAASVGLRFDI